MERPYRPAPRNAYEAARVRRAYNRRNVGAGFLYFGIYFAVQNAVVMLYAIALAFIELARTGGFDASAFMRRFTASSTLLSGIFNLLALVAIWIFFAARRCRFGMETRLVRVRIPALLIMIPLGFSCHILVACALSLLPESLLSSYAASSESLLTATGPLAIFCITVLAPFAEEVVFRGLMYTRFRRGMKKPLALILTALIFGLMHGQLLWAAYAFLLSLLLSAVLDWYGSLWASVLLHISFNATQYIAAPFIEKLPVGPALAASLLLSAALMLLAWRLGRSQSRRLCG